MQKSNLYFIALAGAIGVAGATLFPPNNAAAQPCCSGMTTPAAADADAKATPDLLTTCPVSGEKLDGDMGKPFVFTYKDQEVKLCCKGCKKDFDKDPAKYIKLIRAADNTK